MAIPFGVDRCISSIDAICQGSVEIRRKEGHVQYDDNGLLIIDASFGPTISDPSALRAEILDIPSVVDVGLFIDLATEAIVATDDGQLKHLEFSTSQ